MIFVSPHEGPRMVRQSRTRRRTLGRDRLVIPNQHARTASVQRVPRRFEVQRGNPDGRFYLAHTPLMYRDHPGAAFRDLFDR